MILLRKPYRASCWPACAVVLAATTIVLPPSSRLLAEEEIAAEALPKAGVLEVVITADGDETSTKSLSRALSKLEAIRKAAARQPDATIPLLVSINVNGTTREFNDLPDAIRVIQGITEVLDAAKTAKIQLGELGRLDVDANRQEQSQDPQPKPAPQNQPLHTPTARDGDDGYGIGGGLGGQGGGGAGIGNQQLALQIAAMRRGGAGTRELQIELLQRRLTDLLATQQQSDSASPLAAKEVKLGEATLFSRMVHRDYQKATFSFEFGLRDDPTFLHSNDWDLQYGNGGDHFHVTMVSDDRSRIVDLGKLDWEQLDTKRLAKLPPHPQPRREFVPTALGHIYLVHTVDRNSDLYALFRVEAVDRAPGTCDITWRLVDALQ